MKNSIGKNYIKYVVSYLLVLMFSISCFELHISAAELYTQEELERFNENVELLAAFGLADKGREAATTIKRGDFAAVMLKYLGYENVFVSDGSGFSDVPDKNSPVYGMAQLGLLDGYTDGTYRPDDDILVGQAVKVLVTALGYKTVAETMGGYPVGYMNFAGQTDLLEKVSVQSDAALTYFNLVQMQVNALTIELMEIDSKGGYSVVKNKTWMNSRLDAEKREGVVTAAQGVDLDGAGRDWNDSITIDGEFYSIDGDYSYLIGCYTEFYVNSENEILYIKEKRTEKLELLAEDLESYSKKTYKVDIGNGKYKQYRLSENNYIIFNGSAADSITEEELCPKYGKVTLIDNDNDNRYDTVLVDSYKIYYVQSVNRTDKRIYVKNGMFLDFGSLSDGDLTVTNASGKVLEFEDIAADSVIRVAQTKDEKKAKIILSTATVRGTVTQRSEDGRYQEAYIDGTLYRLADEQVDLSEVAVGKSGTFHLDSEGYIAGVSSGASSYSYGYLLKAYQNEDTEKLELKLIDSSGTQQQLIGASKISIDGLKNQSAEQVVSLLKKGTDSVVKQILRYKCNENGEVREIDTPYNSTEDIKAKPQNGESEDSLRLVYSGTTHYVTQMHNFVGKINVDSSSLLFVIGGDDPEDCAVRRATSLPVTDFQLEAYADDENEFFSKLLVTKDKAMKSGGSDGEVVGVVAKAVEAVGPDGDDATLITFKAKLFEKDLFVADKLVNAFPYNAAQDPMYSLEVGDIVTLQYIGDEASDVTMMYKPSEDLFPSGVSKYGTVTEQRIHYIYGSVYSIEKGFINVTQKDIAANGAPTMDEVESYNLSDFMKIFKCTEVRGKKQVVQVTKDDIVDYKTAGENCSKVFIAVEWEYPNIMVIYE